MNKEIKKGISYILSNYRDGSLTHDKTLERIIFEIDALASVRADEQISKMMGKGKAKHNNSYSNDKFKKGDEAYHKLDNKKVVIIEDRNRERRNGDSIDRYYCRYKDRSGRYKQQTFYAPELKSTK